MRARPPKHPWAVRDDWSVNFYQTTEGSMKRFADYMTEFAKRVPVIHELCAKAWPDKVPSPALIALDLQVRMQ